jgi:hypothetical protein
LKNFKKSHTLTLNSFLIGVKALAFVCLRIIEYHWIVEMKIGKSRKRVFLFQEKKGPSS